MRLRWLLVLPVLLQLAIANQAIGGLRHRGPTSEKADQRTSDKPRRSVLRIPKRSRSVAGVLADRENATVPELRRAARISRARQPRRIAASVASFAGAVVAFYGGGIGLTHTIGERYGQGPGFATFVASLAATVVGVVGFFWLQNHEADARIDEVELEDELERRTAP